MTGQLFVPLTQSRHISSRRCTLRMLNDGDAQFRGEMVAGSPLSRDIGSFVLAGLRISICKRFSVAVFGQGSCRQAVLIRLQAKRRVLSRK